MSKVLFIEDDQDQITIYRVAFERSGIDFEWADNGRDGLAQAVGWQPDLILLDIKMEEMDGIEVLKKLKEMGETKDIPVVMLTNVFKKDLGRLVKKMGAADVWEKTRVLPMEVVRRIKEILEQKGH